MVGASGIQGGEGEHWRFSGGLGSFCARPGSFECLCKGVLSIEMIALRFVDLAVGLTRSTYAGMAASSRDV